MTSHVMHAAIAYKTWHQRSLPSPVLRGKYNDLYIERQDGSKVFNTYVVPHCSCIRQTLPKWVPQDSCLFSGRYNRQSPSEDPTENVCLLFTRSQFMKDVVAKVKTKLIVGGSEQWGELRVQFSSFLSMKTTSFDCPSDEDAPLCYEEMYMLEAEGTEKGLTELRKVTESFVRRVIRAVNLKRLLGEDIMVVDVQLDLSEARDRGLGVTPSKYAHEPDALGIGVFITAIDPNGVLGNALDAALGSDYNSTQRREVYRRGGFIVTANEQNITVQSQLSKILWTGRNNADDIHLTLCLFGNTDPGEDPDQTIKYEIRHGHNEQKEQQERPIGSIPSIITLYNEHTIIDGLSSLSLPSLSRSRDSLKSSSTGSVVKIVQKRGHSLPVGVENPNHSPLHILPDCNNDIKSVNTIEVTNSDESIKAVPSIHDKESDISGVSSFNSVKPTRQKKSKKRKHPVLCCLNSEEMVDPRISTIRQRRLNGYLNETSGTSRIGTESIEKSNRIEDAKINGANNENSIITLHRAKATGTVHANEAKQQAKGARTNDTKQFSELFTKRFRLLVMLDYVDAGIDIKRIYSTMWKKHQPLFFGTGKKCSCIHGCECIWKVPVLVENVIKDHIILQTEENVNAEPERKITCGIFKYFVPRFVPLLLKEFPSDSHDQLLKRLVNMWLRHKKHSTYGTRCRESCSCLVEWDHMFGKGDEAKADEHLISEKRNNKQPPQSIQGSVIPSKNKIQRETEETSTDKTSDLPENAKYQNFTDRDVKKQVTGTKPMAQYNESKRVKGVLRKMMAQNISNNKTKVRKSKKVAFAIENEEFTFRKNEPVKNRVMKVSTPMISRIAFDQCPTEKLLHAIQKGTCIDLIKVLERGDVQQTYRASRILLDQYKLLRYELRNVQKPKTSKDIDRSAKKTIINIYINCWEQIDEAMSLKKWCSLDITLACVDLEWNCSRGEIAKGYVEVRLKNGVVKHKLDAIQMPMKYPKSYIVSNNHGLRFDDKRYFTVDIMAVSLKPTPTKRILGSFKFPLNVIDRTCKLQQTPNKLTRSISNHDTRKVKRGTATITARKRPPSQECILRKKLTIVAMLKQQLEYIQRFNSDPITPPDAKLSMNIIGKGYKSLFHAAQLLGDPDLLKIIARAVPDRVAGSGNSKTSFQT